MPTIDLRPISLALLALVACGACSNPATSPDEAGTTTSPGSGSASESSTATATSTSDDEASETIDDPGFVPLLDEQTAGDHCDPFQQDCPAGEKCVPFAFMSSHWNANKCVPFAGDGEIGDACTSDGIVEATDSCGADSVCWDLMDVDGQAVGTCTGFCKGTYDEPVCAEGHTCLIANEGSITLCIPNCDPVLQDCPEGKSCQWTALGFVCLQGDLPGPYGEPCGQTGHCPAGQACVQADVLPACADTACCTPYCDLDDGMCGWDGTVCTPFFEPGEAPAGYEDVGVCLIPESP